MKKTLRTFFRPARYAAGMEIRPILPEDESLYRELLVSLNERDRYLRFFHTVPNIGASEVLPFVRPRPDMIGLIAVEGGRAVGAAHAFIDDGKAEFAVEVRPDCRHHGIGSKLLAEIAMRLREQGVRELVAHSLFDNAEFALIASEANMAPKQEGAGVNLWRLPL